MGDIRSFDEAAVVYVRHHEVYSTETRTAESQVNVLARYFGGWPLLEITPASVREMVAARRREGASEPTVNRNLAALSKIFSLAIEAGQYQGPNPLRRVRRFHESPARGRVLTADEAWALLRAAPRHLRFVILTAFLTGGRLSEVLRLRWADVDLDAGILYFRRETTKARKERLVPIVPALRAALLKIGPGAPLAPVFTYRGRAFKSIRTSFSRARIRAGVVDIDFHDTRRTFATGFIMRGGDPYRLQKLLGHQSIELTQRYARLSPEYLQAAAEFIGLPPDKRGH